MKKLVRRFINDYDRYGVISAVAWLVLCLVIIAVIFIPANMFFLNVMHMTQKNSGLPAMLLISPVVIYIAPIFWATLFLIAEQMWMLVGIHNILGWEQHKFRKIIGRLAGEQK